MEAIDWSAVAGVSAAAVALVTVAGAVAAIVKRPFGRLREQIESVRDEGQAAHQAIGERIRQSGDKLDARIDDVRGELGGRIDDVRGELGGRIDDVRRELGGRIDDVRRELGGRIDDVQRELDDARRDLNGMRDGFGRMQGTVEQIDKRLSERP